MKHPLTSVSCERTYNGLTTDLQRTYNGPETDLKRTYKKPVEFYKILASNLFSVFIQQRAFPHTPMLSTSDFLLQKT